MTQSISQNENIDSTLLELLNSNQAKNTSNVNDESTENEFSNIINIITSNVEKAQSDFIDEAVKSNTSAINKFALNTQTLKDAKLKDFTPTSILDDRKEIQESLSNFTFESISLRDKFLSVFYPSKDNIETKVSFEDKENINPDITLDSSVCNSAPTAPSPAFSFENQTFFDELKKPLEFSVKENITTEVSEDSIVDYKSSDTIAQQGSKDKNCLESNIPFSIMFDRIAARNASETIETQEIKTDLAEIDKTVELTDTINKQTNILSFFKDIEPLEPVEVNLDTNSGLKSDAKTGQIQGVDSDSDFNFSQSFNGDFEGDFNQDSGNKEDIKQDFTVSKKTRVLKTETTEATEDNETVQQSKEVQDDFIQDIKKELEAEIELDSLKSSSHALSVSDDVAKMSMEADKSFDFASIKTNVNYAGEIVTNSINSFKPFTLNLTNTSEVAFENVFEKNDILNQVSSKFETLKDTQGQKLTLVLRPNDLGRVSIQLTSDSNGLTTNILAQNDEVRAFLEKNIHVLKQQLSDSGLNVNSIQIKTQGQDTFSSYEGNQSAKDSFEQENRQNNQNQENNQENKKEKEQLLFSMSDYDTHFEKDFSSVFNKTINYNL